MVRLPRDITPGAHARRDLLFDGLAAAVLALVAILISAGIGVVAFAAALVLLALTIWICVEAAVRRLTGSGRRLSRRPSSRRR